MKRINLLPPEERVKASRERGLLYAIVILLAVVLALGLVYVKYMRDVSAKEDELAQVNAELAVTQQKVDALQPYAEIQSTRTDMTTTAKALYESGVSFSLILQELSLVIPDNVRLTAMTATVPDAMKAGAAVAAGTTTAASTDITFTGETETHRDVAEFMTRLGLIPQFDDIILTTSTTSESTTGEGESATTVTVVTFTVTAKLRPYLTSPPTTTITTEAGQ